jgi:hypothetical protein
MTRCKIVIHFSQYVNRSERLLARRLRPAQPNALTTTGRPACMLKCYWLRDDPLARCTVVLRIASLRSLTTSPLYHPFFSLRYFRRRVTGSTCDLVADDIRVTAINDNGDSHILPSCCDNAGRGSVRPSLRGRKTSSR